MQKDANVSDQPNQTQTQVLLLLLAAWALGQAIFANGGMWDPMGVTWVGVAMALSALAIGAANSHESKIVSKIPILRVLAVCLAIQWRQLYAWLCNAREMENIANASWIAPMSLMAVGGLGVCFLRRGGFAAFVLVLAGHTLAASIILRHAGDPFIDVWQMQQESTDAMLHGHNPYAVRFRPIYDNPDLYGPGTIVDGWLTLRFPYPPLTLLAVAPARLCGDIRWADLLCMEMAALLIAIAWRDRSGPRAAALLLFNPCSLYMIYLAWTESIGLLIFAALIWCARSFPKWIWLPLGLFIASKQYVPLLAPLALMLLPQPITMRAAMKLLLPAFLLAAIITVPFMLWDPVQFFSGVLLTQLHAPMRMDSLTFTVVIARWTGAKLPSWVGLIAAGVGGVCGWRFLPRTPAGYSLATAFMLLMFFAFTKQAFCNYYFLIIGLMCCALAAARSVAATPASPVSEP